VDAATTILLIVIGILPLPLLFFAHVVLERTYLAYAYRFCRKRGLTVQKWRKERVGESSFVELDCLDQEQRRRLVRLVVWIFGVRAVLSIEEFSDEPLSRAPPETEGLLTRKEFTTHRDAWNSDYDWLCTIWFVAFLVFAFVSFPMLDTIEKVGGVIQGVFVVVTLVSFLGLFYVVGPWRARRRIRRHRLDCPGCRKALVGDRECEWLVLHTGRCWRCGAWVIRQ
jgi:hypothetical protein